MEWVDHLYKETLNKWKEAGSKESGFAIFYSPVRENAKIAIIGYNPGGLETPDMENIKVPAQHEYVHEKYRLAEKVHKIFKSADLLNELENSVKFNLIFFRSQKAHEITNQDLINYSEQKVLETLERINPKIIIAEGFITYNRLIQLKIASETERVTFNNRTIVKVAKTPANSFILGIIHPSGARGISDAILEKMGEIVKNYLDKV